MKELHLWSNKKRFWFYYMLSYAFILGLVLIGMGYETIKAESLFFLAFPTLLLGYWIHYWVNDGLTRSLPSKFETMGYRDYFGIPCTLIHEKERKIVIINLVGKMKVNLSVQQYNFSDLMSIKIRGSSPRGFERALSTNLPKSFLDMRFKGNQSIISVGFRDPDSANKVFELLNPKLETDS